MHHTASMYSHSAWDLTEHLALHPAACHFYTKSSLEDKFWNSVTIDVRSFPESPYFGI